MIPMIFQKYDWDCSVACARMVAPDTPPPEASPLLGLLPEQFVSWADKSGVLLTHGFNLVPTAGMVALVKLGGEDSHYVVVNRVTKRHTFVNCPVNGVARFTHRQFKKIWTGWGMLCR